jgi:hypothetical protein
MATGIIGPKPPINGLVQPTPADTLERCKRVINWLAHIEQPFRGGELDAAESDVLHLVRAALEHAEATVRTRYRLDDDPETHELAREREVARG